MPPRERRDGPGVRRGAVDEVDLAVAAERELVDLEVRQHEAAALGEAPEAAQPGPREVERVLARHLVVGRQHARRLLAIVVHPRIADRADQRAAVAHDPDEVLARHPAAVERGDARLPAEVLEPEELEVGDVAVAVAERELARLAQGLDDDGHAPAVALPDDGRRVHLLLDAFRERDALAREVTRAPHPPCVRRRAAGEPRVDLLEAPERRAVVLPPGVDAGLLIPLLPEASVRRLGSRHDCDDDE